MAFVVTLLGAESTGKTTLAQQLGVALRAQGRSVAVVGEYLREFCDAQGRTPLVHEQRDIALEQARRVDEAFTQHEVVVADTHALMVAIYSDHVFGDTGLYDEALAALPEHGLLLLTHADLPWVADDLQRDGPEGRAPVEALLRAALTRSGRAYAVVSGLGEARRASAWNAVLHALGQAHTEPITRTRWQWVCERCSDGDCERHLLLPHV